MLYLVSNLVYVFSFLSCYFLIINEVSARVSRVLLHDVKSLTLNVNDQTTSRNAGAIDQLKCSGGSARCNKKYIPKVVRCYNRGSDGRDVNWDCQAELHENIRFGRMHVNCEGWDYPDDPYIVAGSCGLRYELDKISSSFDEDSEVLNPFVLVACIFFIFFLVMMFYSKKDDNSQTPSTQPPSYSQTTGTYDYGFSTQQTTENGPGFWTGLGLGGIGGYFMGRNSTDGVNYRRSVPSTRRSPSPVSTWKNGYASTSRR